ncbi:MAG: hypothetical protein GF329_04045 [Candidatus Lokiarchaeota archaeon]|nr:hypothetical protein [Candidatus Lokiarchaeota archaeon]
MIGKYLEDFQEGEKYITPSRTIYLHDITQFCNLVWFNSSIFFDNEYIEEKTVWEKNVVPGPFLISLAVGLFIKMGIYEKTIISLLGIENMKFYNPLVAGETMHAEVEILSTRKSKKDPKKGIMHLQFKIKNVNNDLIMTFEMYHMLKCKK